MSSISAKEAWDLEAGDVIRCQEDNQTRQVLSTFKTSDQGHVDYTDRAPLAKASWLSAIGRAGWTLLLA